MPVFIMFINREYNNNDNSSDVGIKHLLCKCSSLFRASGTHRSKNALCLGRQSAFFVGGDGGIRTHGPD